MLLDQDHATFKKRFAFMYHVELPLARLIDESQDAFQTRFDKRHKVHTA